MDPTAVPASPLAGRRIVVTRPAHQAGDLLSMIEAAGGETLAFPLLDILPADDPGPLAAAAATLASADFAVFISPNAVQYSLPALLAAGWPANLRPVGIGPGTARALAAFGIGNVLLPAGGADSEALLESADLAADRLAGRRVLIFRGDGGRELLADTLRARGACVDCVTCYRRRPPAGGAASLLAWAAERPIDALTVSSSEALRHLVDMLSPDHLAAIRRIPLFAPHPRIVETARGLGFTAVATAPADTGLLAGLCAYNWPSPAVKKS